MERADREPRTDLIRLRRAAGLTQQQLAAALGLTSARAVKAWERGDYAPSLVYAQPLARILGVPLQKLVEVIVGPDPGLAGGEMPGTLLGTSSKHPGARRSSLAPDAAWSGTPSAKTIAALTYHACELARLIRALPGAQLLEPGSGPANRQEPSHESIADRGCTAMPDGGPQK